MKFELEGYALMFFHVESSSKAFFLSREISSFPWEIYSLSLKSLSPAKEASMFTLHGFWFLASREWKALLFGWKVVKHVKSNAIVYAGDERTLGIGAGQMSRVDSSQIAVWKAGNAKLSLKGSVIASDAFFPFADGLIAAAQAGCTAAIQPGGSVRDAEVIAAADENNMAMVFTGVRHFKH